MNIYQIIKLIIAVLTIIIIIKLTKEVYFPSKSSKLYLTTKEEERKKALEIYTKLTPDELIKLEKYELIETVYSRIEYKIIDNQNNNSHELDGLSDKQKTFYILYWYEIEVNNGGLVQFFLNSSRKYTPYISDCLKEVNATEHKKLFDNFIKKENIDLNNLDKILENEDFLEISSEFFDNKFYEMEPIETKLIEYVINNISEF